jgi:hypothetical protein
MAQRPDIFRGAQRTLWGMIAFLAGFIVLLLLIFYRFFVPAAGAAQTADEHGRKILGAYSQLLMAILLVYVLAGLILVFRVGRFFFPRAREPRSKTKYVDAWAEAGKRMGNDTLPPTAGG